MPADMRGVTDSPPGNSRYCITADGWMRRPDSATRADDLALPTPSADDACLTRDMQCGAALAVYLAYSHRRCTGEITLRGGLLCIIFHLPLKRTYSTGCNRVHLKAHRQKNFQHDSVGEDANGCFGILGALSTTLWGQRREDFEIFHQPLRDALDSTRVLFPRSAPARGGRAWRLGGWTGGAL